MANIENIKVNNTTYPLRDANTLRSLTQEQRTILESVGSYNGEPVTHDEVFLDTTGKFVQDTVTSVEGLIVGYNIVSTVPENINGRYARIGFFDNGNGIKRVVLCCTTSGGGNFYYSDDKGATFSSGSGSVSGLGNSSGASFFINSKAVLMVLTSNVAVCGKSTDGISYSNNPITLPETATTTRMMVFKDKFYIFDNAGWYINSEDGTSWSAKKTFPTVTSISNIVCNLDAIYIFADNMVYKSEDGETWDNGNASNYYGTISACGHLIFCMKSNSPSKHGISTDGKVFTEESNTVIGSSNPDVYYYCDGTYVAGYASVFKTSTDGTNWSELKYTRYDDSGTTRTVAAFGSYGAREGTTAECDTFLCCIGFTPNSASPKIVDVNTGITYTSTLSDLSYDLSGVNAALSGKQDTLTAGTGIDITGNVISATGGGNVELQDIAFAGKGILIEDAVEDFTVVGSPTITNGVVSNLTGTDRINIPQLSAITSSFELTMSCVFEDTSPNQWVWPICATTTSYGKCGIFQTGNFLGCFYAGAGSGGDNIDLGYKYWLKILYTGGYTKFYALKDNNYTKDTLPAISSWTELDSTQENYFTTANVCFGNDITGSEPQAFTGSIDMNDQNIALDGNSSYWSPYPTDGKPAITTDIGSGASAPTSSTVGYVGKLYVTDGGSVYICTGISGSTYTWAQITVS